MTFSEKAKNEILGKNFDEPCCQLSALSAFVRGAGTISTHDGNVGFETVTENENAFAVFDELIKTLYGVEPVKSEFTDKLTGRKKYSLTVVNGKSLSILVELGIVSIDGGGLAINLSIDRYITENDCCKKAYVRGAFIGSGSVTVPSVGGKTNKGYHLEFVFSKYQTANDFAALLTEQGFLPKLTERKETFVIYFKNGEEISDILAYMGATKSCFELKDVIISKDIRNDTNRKVNCEIGNLSKQVDASIKQIKSINAIIETVGLESLPSNLKDTAELRLDNPDATLEELSALLGVSKSCMNHRLRKLIEIAKNLVN